MRILPLACAFSLCVSALSAQPYGEPDRGQPGDEMIQQYLAKEALRLDGQFPEDCKSLKDWQSTREQYREEYLYMLGLWPLPEKTDLKATVTGTLERDGYVVEKLHYQSVPGLYVTANLYRPANAESRQRFPAVLYVCGHANRGRDGNKTAYQAHPIWLAKHGFICLIVDTLEFGEINDHPRYIHHGTYNLERWWWHSRGYTPAGVECWNGVRGIDYLLSRADVDPDNIGVTGISGGGAATFWIAAADERIKVAIPVSGMADLESYVGNRVINGHCDCMFLYNTFQWPWTRIAGLIAPRPMLFINSDNDRIFPMDANERITNRMERLYSLYGASDKFDTIVSVGGHAYREDIRRAAFQFLRYHLQGSAEPVTDSEVDLVDESTKPPTHPIPAEDLRVFPTDDDLPKDALNLKIDEHFVPLAKPELPKKGEYDAWRKKMLAELRRVAFRAIPEKVHIARDWHTFRHRDLRKASSTRPPHLRADAVRPGTGQTSKLFGPKQKDESEKREEKKAKLVVSNAGVESREKETDVLQTEKGVAVLVTHRVVGTPEEKNKRVAVILQSFVAGDQAELPEWLESHFENGECVLLNVRGEGLGQWTTKNPPNYVERSHALLGQTADSGRIRDLLSVTGSIQKFELTDLQDQRLGTLHFLGHGRDALIGAYAAVLDEQKIQQVTLIDPPTTHMDPAAPQFLNILRVCDVPDMLGLLAPRPLKIVTKQPDAFERTRKIYAAAGAADALVIQSSGK